MDVFDRAQENDEFFRKVALQEHFAGQKINSLERPKPGPHSTEAVPGVGRICSDCGEEIETARLEALPYAVRCLDCQTKQERRERHG